ncbi:MAG: hypothetical protein ACTHNK_16820 [Thermomicrobiales bacterium]|jgi:hypothetical protein|nr:hypothetical protein [Thermomicrobiales bacterium]
MTKRHWRTHGWTGVVILSGLALLTITLAGCGTTQMATNAVPTLQGAVTTAATAAPPGAGATAAVLATQVATARPELAATAAALATQVAGTGNAAATQVAPTVQALATAAAGSTSGPEATVTGKVTRADPNARTFTVQGQDGQAYDFTVTTNTQVDFTTLARDVTTQQQVTVTYRKTTTPYEVVSVR